MRYSRDTTAGPEEARRNPSDRSWGLRSRGSPSVRASANTAGGAPVWLSAVGRFLPCELPRRQGRTLSKVGRNQSCPGTPTFPLSSKPNREIHRQRVADPSKRREVPFRRRRFSLARRRSEISPLLHRIPAKPGTDFLRARRDSAGQLEEAFLSAKDLRRNRLCRWTAKPA